MSEDRNKHDRAGTAETPLGHRVGKPKVERVTGVGQRIPESVRDKIKGNDAK